MLLIFQRPPRLVKKENKNIGQDSCKDQDKPRNPKEEDKSLSKIGEECNTDKSVDSGFGEGLKVVDDPFIETVEVFDNSDPDKSRTRNKRKDDELGPIDKWNRQLHSWNKIGEQSDFVGEKEKSIDDQKMEKRSAKAEFEHELRKRVNAFFCSQEWRIAFLSLVFWRK